MSEGVVFEEVQRFRQGWLWGLMLAATAVAASIAILDGLTTPELLVLSVFPPVLLLFYFAELRTEVRSDGVYFRFNPLHRGYVRVPLEEIESWRRENYSPFDYRGWGIRNGVGRGKAYTVSGDDGVRIQRAGNPSLIIGSQRPKEFVDAINQAVKTAGD